MAALYRLSDDQARSWPGRVQTLSVRSSLGLYSSRGYPDGTRFDTSTDQVVTLDLDCETPQGRRVYGGKFATTEIARR